MVREYLRQQCWRKWYGASVNGKCVTCDTIIVNIPAGKRERGFRGDEYGFQCGHIHPESRGGPNILENVVPLCGGCNRSMSNNYLIPWAKKNYPLALSRMRRHGIYDIPPMSAREMFYIGENCEDKGNEQAAFSWYTRSANLGNADAQNNLGTCYELGYATEKNLELAKHWYRLASEKGHSIAIENLKDIS